MVSRRRAFTLVEILVASACLAIFGLVLTVLLNGSIRLWSGARAQRVAYDRAQSILGILHDDLKAVNTREEPSTGAPTPVEVYFKIWPAPTAAVAGTPTPVPRLSFVRGVSDAERAVNLRVATPTPAGLTTGNGLVRVTYWVSPPAASGGLLSLYRTVEPVTQAATPLPSPAPALLANDLLHFGVESWIEVPWDRPASTPAAVPLSAWDSTRSDLAIGQFGRYEPSPTSDPSDDVFPEMVRVTLVVEPSGYPAVIAKLMKSGGLTADEDGGLVELDSTEGFPVDARDEPYLSSQPSSVYFERRDSMQYMKIGNEWIRYGWNQTGLGQMVYTTPLVGKQVWIGVGGRGARGTAKAAHAQGEEIHIGRQFTVTWRLPAYRDAP